jgi:[1-hydroxy-2-(trimethylamino)ethyl]phosphonate dioxygenase
VSVADEIFGIFSKRGSGAYFGEAVSVTEHCLQAAYFAQLEQAPPRLVIAALLHDIGHLVVEVPDDLEDWTEDARHEQTGSDWLALRFGLAISEPVRLHVPAKRYLCATQQSYFQKLSPASVKTLQLQGGPMSAAEVAAFEAERFFREAIRVREWDDRGKIAGLSIPELSSYRVLLEAEGVKAV